jgi:serine/threonine protein kinase
MAALYNAPLPDGLEIAGYRIVKKIASGGFSIVYLAYDTLGVVVAIKEFLPAALAARANGELAPHVVPEHRAVYDASLKCFFDEGRALARITHPNVVRVLNFFRAHETVYMVMAYEPGGTLQHQLQHQLQQGAMDAATIGALFHPLLQGLREVHAHKLLHLDIAPANIWLRPDGSPMLLDFGAARQVLRAGLLHGASTPLLTPYAAPELYQQRGRLGPWTDVYGIGAAMYACLAGAPPPPADQRRLSDTLAAQRGALPARYPAALLDLVHACLALEPLDRPQSLFALQKVLKGMAPVPASVPVPAPVPVPATAAGPAAASTCAPTPTAPAGGARSWLARMLRRGPGPDSGA